MKPAFQDLSKEQIQEQVLAVLGGTLAPWRKQCHAASLAVVKAQPFSNFLRVARGICKDVGGQHSWIVVGEDCYDPDASIIDPALWSYDPNVHGVWVGSARDWRHRPFGAGSIWDHGRPKPEEPSARTVQLVGADSLSDDAKEFLEILGPLSHTGWRVLANSPVEGWPAGEIFEAMHRTPKLTGLLRIDVRGMTTHVNPGGLYLALTTNDEPDVFFRAAEIHAEARRLGVALSTTGARSPVDVRKSWRKNQTEPEENP